MANNNPYNSPVDQQGRDVSMPTARSVRHSGDVSMPTVRRSPPLVVEMAWSGLLSNDTLVPQAAEGRSEAPRPGLFQLNFYNLDLPWHFVDSLLPMAVPNELLDYGHLVDSSIPVGESMRYFEKVCAHPHLGKVRLNGWDFFSKVCYQHKLCLETFSNVINYFDMYLARAKVSNLKNSDQNLMWAVTCLRVGLKMVEHTGLNNEQWATHFHVDANLLDKYERELCRLLDWKFNRPSAFTFFYYFKEKMNIRFAREGGATEVAALRAIMCTYRDHRFLGFLPHEIAASVMLVYSPTPLDDRVIHFKTTKERVAACVDLFFIGFPVSPHGLRSRTRR